MENLLTAHAHISRQRNRLLVRLTCAGRVLWRSYPLDMPEDEAVMRAVKRLFPIVQPEAQRQNQKEADIGGNDGSGNFGVSHDSLPPPVPDERENEGNERRPCANPKGKSKQRKPSNITSVSISSTIPRLLPFGSCGGGG